MTFELRQNLKDVTLHSEGENICTICNVEKISNTTLKGKGFILSLVDYEQKIKFKLVSSSYQIIQIEVSYAEKLNKNEAIIISDSKKYKLCSENFTLISNQNISTKCLIGFNQNHEFEIENYGKPFIKKNINDSFKSQNHISINSTNQNSKNFFKNKASKSEASTLSNLDNSSFQAFNAPFPSFVAPSGIIALKNPPAFSITFSTTVQAQTTLFKSYKDQQILNGNLNRKCFVSVISNIPNNLVDEVEYPIAILKQYYETGFNTSYQLPPDSSIPSIPAIYGYAGWSTNINLSDQLFTNQKDGVSKFFVSIKPFFLEYSFTTKSLVQSGDSYTPLPLNNIGLSSINFNSMNFNNNPIQLISAGISTIIGFSTFAATPSWIYSSAFRGTKVPDLNASLYLPFSYESIGNSLNGFIGGICSCIGTSGAILNFDYAQALFITKEDLHDPIVDVSSYNINFKIKYADGTETQIEPLKKNINVYNNGSQNFISAIVNWTKYYRPANLFGIEANISKKTDIFPNEFRFYQFCLYNLDSTAEQPFVTQSLKIDSESEVVNNLENQNDSTKYFSGDSLISYENGQNLEANLLRIKIAKEEPLVVITTQNYSIEVPESTYVFKQTDASNIEPIAAYSLKIGNKIKTDTNFDEVLKISFKNHEQNFIFKTSAGNYYLNHILIEPSFD
jgi:hypothetical protein